MNKPKDMNELKDLISDAVSDYAWRNHDDSVTVKLCITVDDGWTSVSEDDD